jgi:Phage major capsid protein E
MPQPTLGDVHVNRPLTNISVAYSQEAAGVEFVADRAFPGIPVESKSDLYYTYKRADFNRDEMQQRALGTESAGSGYGLDSTGTYNCNVWALHKDVDDQIRANSDSPLSPDRDATIFLTNKALISRENVWAGAFFKTGVWTGEVAGAGAADSTHVVYWDSATSSPITDIRHAKTQMRLNSGGFAGNIAVFSRSVFDKLVDHPDFVDRTKYGQTAPNPAMVTRAIVAEILELEEVLVMDAVYNTAAEGAAESTAFIGGLSAALFYRPRNPGLMTPSAGYTFNWTGLIGSTGGAGLRIKTFRMEHLASDRVEIDAAYDMRSVSKDCGFFFNNVISAV